MYNIGSIILLKNFIYKDHTGTKKIDHAKYRPCLVIGEDNENIYILPISSSILKNNRESHYEIPNKYIDINKKEYIDFNAIYKAKICGYRVKDDLDTNDLYDLLTSFYQYHTKNNNEEFNKIKDIIYNEIKKLETTNKHIR